MRANIHQRPSTGLYLFNRRPPSFVFLSTSMKPVRCSDLSENKIGWYIATWRLQNTRYSSVHREISRRHRMLHSKRYVYKSHRIAHYHRAMIIYGVASTFPVCFFRFVVIPTPCLLVMQSSLRNHATLFRNNFLVNTHDERIGPRCVTLHGLVIGVS